MYSIMSLDKHTYYLQHREESLQRSHEYYLKNKERISEYNRKYYQNNKDRIYESQKGKQKQWKNDNRIKLNEYKRTWCRRKWKTRRQIDASPLKRTGSLYSISHENRVPGAQYTPRYTP